MAQSAAQALGQQQIFGATLQILDALVTKAAAAK
jgi:hypothetical protein